MLIEDEVEAAAILSRVNYYRLSGYFRYWQVDPDHQDGVIGHYVLLEG